MSSFKNLIAPQEGSPSIAREGMLLVPDNPVVCYINGDGVGSEIGPVTRNLIDTAVQKIWCGKKRISWLKLCAGKEALLLYKELLPTDTLEAIRYYRICLKGPLETPVGDGHRSLNVAIRQELNLYANVRPIRYIAGVPSPVKHPERVDMIVFRENTEDVYAGIEWQQGSQEALEVISFVAATTGVIIPREAGIGIKVISSNATKRLVRAALDYALAHHRRSVTFVTKGNIMKYTEGAFRGWAYEVAREEYGPRTVTEEECLSLSNGRIPEGKLLVRDRLADDMLQQILLYPERYDVIAAPNLNGDYLSDALAAQVGGIGIAPGANIGDQVGVFEATHGTAPALAGKNCANPTGLMLSAVLMLEYMGWGDAAHIIRQAVESTIGAGEVTQDLALQSEGLGALSTSEFAEAVLKNI